jgi:hypothetical protein
VFEHGDAEIGDGELAGGPQEQSFAELRFQRGDSPLDRRLGDAQALRGTRKTAFIHDAREEQEIVWLEVHGL